MDRGLDIRAGAIRALSRTGIVAERDQLDDVIVVITTRAAKAVYRLVAEVPPAHVKAFIATETVRTKVRLAGRLDLLARPGRSFLPNELHRFASNEDISTLDASQSVAACAIAGTDGLVAVTGPAGTGKTTMLRVALAALRAQRRRMLVVAPTRKAATVASREVGAAASSVHALLANHGYRWGSDVAGAKVWTRLGVGEIDPSTGVAYGGPAPYVLRSRDRIVVDSGLGRSAESKRIRRPRDRTGGGSRVRRGPAPGAAGGHSGAMGSAVRHANTAVELDTVHWTMIDFPAPTVIDELRRTRSTCPSSSRPRKQARRSVEALALVRGNSHESWRYAGEPADSCDRSCDCPDGRPGTWHDVVARAMRDAAAVATRMRGNVMVDEKALLDEVGDLIRLLSMFDFARVDDGSWIVPPALRRFARECVRHSIHDPAF